MNKIKLNQAIQAAEQRAEASETAHALTLAELRVVKEDLILVRDDCMDLRRELKTVKAELIAMAQAEMEERQHGR